MARNTEQFDMNGQLLTVLCAQGPDDLDQCLAEIRQNQDPVAKFQQHTNILSQFFKPKMAEKPDDMQAILYRNGPVQQSLIMTNGKDHYFYDLIKGAAATVDVKAVLGPQLVDVSGAESREYLQIMNNDVGRVRETLASRLTTNIQTAMKYAMHQIEAAQKHPELRQGTAPRRG